MNNLVNSLSQTPLALQRMRLRPHILSCFQFVSLGRIIPSENALTRLSEMDLTVALMRHATCNWGYATIETWLANANALVKNKPVFSIHYSKSGVQFYVITESDRSVTLIQLAQD